MEKNFKISSDESIQVQPNDFSIEFPPPYLEDGYSISDDEGCKVFCFDEDIACEIQRILYKKYLSKGMENKKRIIVQVEGGLVQAVFSNDSENLDCDVLDLDNLKEETDPDQIHYYEDLQKDTKDLKQIY